MDSDFASFETTSVGLGTRSSEVARNFHRLKTTLKIFRPEQRQGQIYKPSVGTSPPQNHSSDPMKRKYEKLLDSLRP